MNDKIEEFIEWLFWIILHIGLILLIIGGVYLLWMKLLS